jgi:hypothetical protein
MNQRSNTDVYVRENVEEYIYREKNKTRLEGFYQIKQKRTADGE